MTQENDKLEENPRGTREVFTESSENQTALDGARCRRKKGGVIVENSGSEKEEEASG